MLKSHIYFFSTAAMTERNDMQLHDLKENCSRTTGGVSPCLSDSSDHDTASITDRSSPVKKLCNRWQHTEFNVERWAECPEESVEEIPTHIDGWCKFVIACNYQDVMKLTKDGRPWRTSSRKHFNGMRRVTRCKGSFTCAEESCLFKKQHGKCNKYHFETKSGMKSCFTCGSTPEVVPCKAIKFGNSIKRKCWHSVSR